eukprot:TRINITY_DN4559_c0_g1_i1.p1 TRINITY_DN4559_c0_g1~~TRINITY_DN4559_c0_g1_i1.p1  ORF type:complete len:212 (+),score=41.23 TRINITY_DN4559_c0_g1_i1:243-878(+)
MVQADMVERQQNEKLTVLTEIEPPPQQVVVQQPAVSRDITSTPLAQSMESFKGYTPPTPASVSVYPTAPNGIVSPPVGDRHSGMRRSETVKPTYLSSTQPGAGYQNGGPSRNLTRRMSAPPERRMESEIGDLLKQTDLLRSRTKHFKAELADQISYLKTTIHSDPSSPSVPLLSTGPRIDIPFDGSTQSIPSPTQRTAHRGVSPEVHFQRV